MTALCENPSEGRRVANRVRWRLPTTVDVQVASGEARIDLEFRAGRNRWVTSLEGHGQDGFLQALAGVKPIRGAVVALDGASERELRGPVARRSPPASPTVRASAATSHSSKIQIMANVQRDYGLETLSSHRRRGFIDAKQMQVALAGYVDRLKIKVPRHSLPVTALGGGNRQKVILTPMARGMSPKVLLLNDPTRGIDIAAKHDIYKVLRSAGAESVCVVMLTTELIKIMDLI